MLLARPLLAPKPALLCAALALSACAGERTGALITPAPPPAAPRLTGAAPRGADADHAALLAAFGGEYRSPALAGILRDLIGQLVPRSERPDQPYEATILDSAGVNAFALPSGRLYVTRGLLALANDEAELAAVLAHEMAHVGLRHADARGEMEARSALVSRVVSDVLRDAEGGARLRDRSRLTLSGFSRAQELEADRAGIATLAGAGFDPYGASRFLAALGRHAALDKRADAGVAADMSATHPATAERVSLAVAAARKVSAPGIGRTGRDRYLNALQGLAYGDDPRDGVVRGPRFLHPRLRVAFEAPSGYELENTPKAVLGASPDGQRRLLFDAVEAPAGQSLTALLTESWSERLDPESLRATAIGGHEAAIAASAGAEWRFRLAALRVGPNTFRVILASRDPAGPTEDELLALAGSVRELAPAEAASLRPLRIGLVRAERGTSAAALAARMATDRRLDRFLALNGLAPGASPVAGERYKVAVE